MSFKASKYKISTITVVGSVNCDINLKALFDNVCIEKFPYIEYIEHGDNKYTQNIKGHRQTKTKKTKRFDNQVTIILVDDDNRYNIKTFKNGNVQITGVKDIDKGYKCIDKLIEFIKLINNVSQNTVIPEKQVCQLRNTNYKVCLINSDFKVNFEIKRDILYKVLCKSFDVNCTYEPCIYPGVKIAYFVDNDIYNKSSYNGVCKCNTQCNGKKQSKCKRITIAIFQSGCVIITGANSIEHIEETYNFVNNILETYMDIIIRKKFIIE